MINIKENGCQARSPRPCYSLNFDHAQKSFITGLLRGDVFFILSVMDFVCHQMSFRCGPTQCIHRARSPSRFIDKDVCLGRKKLKECLETTATICMVYKLLGLCYLVALVFHTKTCQKLIITLPSGYETNKTILCLLSMEYI